MRLADFIIENLEAVVNAWEEFAKTILPAATLMSSVGLRDHAEQMLKTIVEDLRTPQSAKEQQSKSRGNGPDSQRETPAETHALDRHLSGFTIDQMVSEYRALRASVLKLWLRRDGEGGDLDIEDMMRFNEAIDQALAESVGSYSRAVTSARNVFLGILGHDLRSPLGAILVSSEMLARAPGADAKTVKISSRIQASVIRATQIVEDLLDFTRSQMGTGIPVYLERTDITTICQNLVDETRAANPERKVRFESSGEVIGLVDPARIGQIFSNLIGNALKHGSRVAPIKVSVIKFLDNAVIEVHNEGAPIPDDVLPFIFNFLSSHSQHAEENISGRMGLGLGLYIVSEIVTAHGGTIEVKSSKENGTAFTVTLPLGSRSFK